VGKLMRKIHAEFPHLDLETIREASRASLYGVGGENRISIAFNRLLQSQKLDNAPRRVRPNAQGLVSALVSGTSSANQRSV